MGDCLQCSVPILLLPRCCCTVEVFIYSGGKSVCIPPTNVNPNTNKFLSKCSRWRKPKAVRQADIRGAALALTSSTGSCFIHQP